MATEAATAAATNNGFPTEGEVQALATSKDKVCWSSFSAGAPRTSVVACANKRNGKRTELVRDTLVHPGLAVSGSDVYWSSEMTATIDRAPLVGGPASPFVTTKGPHGRFVVARGSFYWTVDAGQQGTQLLTATGTSSPTKLVSLGAVDPGLLAVVEYTVYDHPVAFWFGNGVRHVSTGGNEPPEQLSGGCFYPSDLAADSEYAYWSCEDRTFHWAAWRGGKEHVEHDAGFGQIATFGGAAYVTDVLGGRILRARAADGVLEVVRTGLDQPSWIAVDESGIYASERGRIRRYPL